jgi:hypothetical protein
MFCLNYFIPKRKGQAYCCGGCQEGENDAKKEYKRTLKSDEYNAPTYLPKMAYKTKRVDTVEADYKEKEIAFRPEFLTDVIIAREEIDADKDKTKPVDRKHRKFNKKAEIDVAYQRAKKTPQSEVKSFNLYDMSYAEIIALGWEKKLYGGFCDLSKKDRFRTEKTT